MTRSQQRWQSLDAHRLCLRCVYNGSPRIDTCAAYEAVLYRDGALVIEWGCVDCGWQRTIDAGPGLHRAEVILALKQRRTRVLLAMHARGPRAELA